MSDLAQSQMTQTDDELERLRRANHTTLLTLWIATVLGALFGGSFSFFLARKITRAVSLVAERANAFAAGDLTGEALDLHSQDQIGTLAVAMQQMQNNLSGIIGTVVQTAGSLTGSAASMRTAGDQIHRRIYQQSQQTQQAATAMQEMSASIAEVSRHTQSAADTARNAAETARDGGTIVKLLLGSMHSIATAVNDISATVGLLGDDSRRISQIVTVIDEIARKTNLLALNAAIEAARAGVPRPWLRRCRRRPSPSRRIHRSGHWRNRHHDPRYPGPHPNRHRQHGERHRHRPARSRHYHPGR